MSSQSFSLTLQAPPRDLRVPAVAEDSSPSVGLPMDQMTVNTPNSGNAASAKKRVRSPERYESQAIVDWYSPPPKRPTRGDEIRSSYEAEIAPKLAAFVKDVTSPAPEVKARRLDDTDSYDVVLSAMFSIPSINGSREAELSINSVTLFHRMLVNVAVEWPDESSKQKLVACTRLLEQLMHDMQVVDKLCMKGEFELRCMNAWESLSEVWAQRITALSDGGSLMIPIGISDVIMGHAMALEVACRGETFDVIIYNSAAGGPANFYHPFRLDLDAFNRNGRFNDALRMQPCVVTQIARDALLNESGKDKWRMLAKMQYIGEYFSRKPKSSEDLWREENSIYQMFQPQALTPRENAYILSEVPGARFTAPQKINNCHWSVLKKIVQHHMGADARLVQRIMERHVMSDRLYERKYNVPAGSDVYVAATRKVEERFEKQESFAPNQDSRVPFSLPFLHVSADFLARGDRRSSRQVKTLAELYIRQGLQPLAARAAQARYNDEPFAGLLSTLLETDLSHSDGSVRFELTGDLCLPVEQFKALKTALRALDWKVSFKPSDDPTGATSQGFTVTSNVYRRVKRELDKITSRL